MIVVAGGQVLTAEGWKTLDIGIEGDLITVVGVGLKGDRVIRADGCLVGPGLVDIHTHLREPGQTWKEDIMSGSRAAAAGGFTAVVAMPNTEPAMDSVETVEWVRRRGESGAVADVIPAGTLTIGRSGESAAPLEDLYESGVRIFTDDGDAVEDEVLVKELMSRLADLPGAVFAQHAEMKTQTAGGHMHQGAVSTRLGIGGLPSSAEVELIARDLDLVAATGVTYLCQHVSAAKSLELISQAQESGLSVAAEVTPHHLALSEESVADLDPDFKMYPPLRSSEDREALVEALREGTISVVATDHAPHSAADKAVSFEDAPRGVIGLETSAAVTWSVLEDPDRFFQVMSANPRHIAGIEAQTIAPGAPADLVVFDPAKTWQPAEFESKSSNSPFKGQEMKGKVLNTIYRGRVTHG